MVPGRQRCRLTDYRSCVRLLPFAPLGRPEGGFYCLTFEILLGVAMHLGQTQIERLVLEVPNFDPWIAASMACLLVSVVLFVIAEGMR